jgi:CheY-like chemotaxis protein
VVATPREQRTLRVLVLDDDLDTREVLKLILCPEEGFEMVGCADTESCLAHLRTTRHGEAPPFDVLLLDVLLPGGHAGTEILAACESGRADVSRLPPVVACTALSEAALAPYLPLLDHFGARIIRKPFGIETVLAALRAAVAG